MGLVTVALSLLLGLILGLLISVGILIYYGKRIKKAEKAALTPTADPSLKEKALEKMKMIKEITKSQLEMQSKAEGPQRNSLDGKYKNGLSREIQRMEEEKTELMKSILSSGFDPEVKILNSEGEVQSMKLSEFLANSGIKTSTEKNEEPKSKLTLHQGGKFDDDGDGNETSH